MSGREWAEAEYSRIYWTVVDDPKFEHVFDDDRRWAAYTRLLMAAEATYPSAAPLPRWLADDVLTYLVEVRIIEVVRGQSYRIVGLKTEREGRLGGKAIGGLARAEKAERDEHGRFVPAPGAGTSDEPAEAPEGPATSSNGTSKSPARSTSGAPAGQLRRDEDEDEDEDRRDENLSENLKPRATADRPDVQALRDRGWKRVSAKQRKVLDEVLARHDATGAAFAAEVIKATPRDTDPLEAVMDADRRWQALERQRINGADADWKATKAADLAEHPRVEEKSKLTPIGDTLADGPSWLTGTPEPAEAKS